MIPNVFTYASTTKILHARVSRCCGADKMRATSFIADTTIARKTSPLRIRDAEPRLGV